VASIGSRSPSFQIVTEPHSVGRPIGEKCQQQPQYTQVACSTLTTCQRRMGECLCADDADLKLMVPKVDATFLPSDN
jgi:hypothetical protein